jgi:quinol monooxygenase YgiN
MTWQDDATHMQLWRSDVMIIRIFRVRVRPGTEAGWQQRVEAHSIAWMRAQTGLVSFYPGRPLAAEDREFCMVSIWQDLDSLRAAVGEHWQRAVLLADEADLVDDIQMHHYETFSI